MFSHDVLSYVEHIAHRWLLQRLRERQRRSQLQSGNQFAPDLGQGHHLAAEYGGENSVYYDDMDRVAYRLWGGTWSDIEEALDTYLISELKAEGFTGLK